jgi:alpha-beta hydrolase superfamily lysophospholipase
MTLPTIVALQPDRYAAVIMVGGGADFWLMNQRSNYRDLIRAVKETWVGEKPSAEVLAKLDEFYLRHAALDSYHTAASLKGKPVLIIQGTSDRAVPAPLGNLLWERLGKPERWLEEGAGHEALFMNLPRDYYPRMMHWIDQSVPRAGAAEHAADSSSQPAGTP